MMVLMSVDATQQQIDDVIQLIKQHNLKPLHLPGDEHVAIGIASAIPPELREPLTLALQALPGVDHVVQISRPYKLASREFWRTDTVVQIGEVKIGGNAPCVIMAGPCSVESREQIFTTAQAVKAAGAKILRGGAYKPRTSPYSFQGLGLEGLKLLKEVSDQLGILTVSEVMSPEDVEKVAEHVDILQIGARNMQNYALLVAVGRSGRPTLLKRGIAATIDEFLLAAEYLLHHGTKDVILCERGIHPLDRTYTRYTLDLNAVPVIKHLSHLPVIVDPSHGTGAARYVPAMARAAIAAGADGLLIEVHPDPKAALSDGAQSLTPEQFSALMKELERVAMAVGRCL
ncbi:MAG TPA: 3-deoxy-7-phosphoheptulonate synthase [Chthonomonas sp.]|uniref:3-deoxy-7-phosphoheptulonate synthase n=1 Tax=Chthonomonas sp. TaxID=2282153 RepID=UPI002B4B52FB|nr:3-deoxy-7-phosphoheptulonate synthase [Chthonomonas sp.]HLI49465.1 3-deoxy-7-phosphoheptulonate synthase [Chthonomonas sp.]